MSQLRYLLPPVPCFFKACLHAHSTVTDGKLSPKAVKEAYKEKGYSILSLTDHNVVADHSSLNDPDFLMLTGIEINTCQNGFHPRMKTYHLNLIAKQPGLRWQPFPKPKYTEDARPHVLRTVIGNMSDAYSVEAVNAVIAEANRQGYLVCYNHPEWSLQNYCDYAPLKGLWAMELCNNGNTVMGYNDRDNSKVYQDLVNLGNRIVPLGTDDCHGTNDMFGAWTMIGAEKLEYASVIQAMERGNLYASTGPDIYNLTLEGDKLTVQCSDAQYITLETSCRFACSATPTRNDSLLREATFNISPWMEYAAGSASDWLRIVVRDPYGHYAATRAYFGDELA